MWSRLPRSNALFVMEIVGEINSIRMYTHTHIMPLYFYIIPYSNNWVDDYAIKTETYSYSLNEIDRRLIFFRRQAIWCSPINQ